MYELSGFKFKWESDGEREEVWGNLFLTFEGASPKEHFSHGMFFFQQQQPSLPPTLVWSIFPEKGY